MTGRYRRVAALICFVCCVLCSTLSVTAAVADQEKRHVIKVGYIDYDGFITEEKDGTYTGYGVEYLKMYMKNLILIFIDGMDVVHHLPYKMRRVKIDSQIFAVKDLKNLIPVLR